MNDFTSLPDADPALVLKAQRMVLKAAVQRQIFCPITGHLLDLHTAVDVVPSSGPAAVLDPDVWDDRCQGVLSEASLQGVHIEIYDGRMSFS